MQARHTQTARKGIENPNSKMCLMAPGQSQPNEREGLAPQKKQERHHCYIKRKETYIKRDRRQSIVIQELPLQKAKLITSREDNAKLNPTTS